MGQGTNSTRAADVWKIRQGSNVRKRINEREIEYGRQKYGFTMPSIFNVIVHFSGICGGTKFNKVVQSCKRVEF